MKLRRKHYYLTGGQCACSLNLNNNITTMNIQIEPYKEEYKDKFVELTKSWLNEYFWIEPSDEKLFANPAAAYIETGGEILIALDTDNNVVAGVCALVFHPKRKFGRCQNSVSVRNIDVTALQKDLSMQLLRQRNRRA